MRLLFGMILGAFLTIGGAYIYDTATAPSLASTAQTLEGKPMVNWDVVGEQWRLPAAVIETMAHHHSFLEASAERPYVALAALADSLTTYALKQPPELLEQVLRNLTPPQLLAHPAAQFLKLGLVDEISIHLVPVLFGSGIRLFEHLGSEHVQLEKTEVIETKEAIHLRFRLLK